MIPAAALCGGGLLVLADALSRTLHPPQGFPLAVVTAALGAPVLAWLVLRRIGGLMNKISAIVFGGLAARLAIN